VVYLIWERRRRRGGIVKKSGRCEVCGSFGWECGHDHAEEEDVSFGDTGESEDRKLRAVLRPTTYSFKNKPTKETFKQHKRKVEKFLRNMEKELALRDRRGWGIPSFDRQLRELLGIVEAKVGGGNDG
jgi:hypothetical protein